MRLMRFNATAEYAPSCTLVVADTLSRSPLRDTKQDTHKGVECYVASVIAGMPATEEKMSRIRAATAAVDKLKILTRYIHSGWPRFYLIESEEGTTLCCNRRHLQAVPSAGLPVSDTTQVYTPE